MEKFLSAAVAALCILLSGADAGAVQRSSIYTLKPEDSEAAFFNPGDYGVRADGRGDVSEALQNAIDKLKTENNFGILFIPEGKYRISRTIYIPPAIRLIGYGERRPEFILTRNSPGFADEHPEDKGGSKYMFWFTGGLVRDENRVPDAGAGTFYSGMSNIDLRIEDGNPNAIALRTHYAQHSFVSYCTVNIGGGKAGLYDVGNEMENVAFIGGQYGIITTKASPGWQVMMADCLFEGQKVAAVRSQEAGLAIVNMQVRNVPTVFFVEDNYWEKLYIENSRFENISGPVFRIPVENNSNTSITLRRVVCGKAPLLVDFPRSGESVRVNHKNYIIHSFEHGLVMDSLDAEPEYRTFLDSAPLDRLPEVTGNDIPQLPPMREWVSVKDFGAVGDGIHDDTEAIRRAVSGASAVYFPTGWYKVSNTVTMLPGTSFIGLHPFATQLIIEDNSPAYGSFGTPKALLESSRGGRNILNGIGINTGSFNYRAVGVKWMAGADSYLNDVKFVGGHGTMSNPKAPAVAQHGSNYGRENWQSAWDNQHWSLWVTEGGGGTFKDIWTANTYASCGFYAENTSTPGRIYAMSLEHHVRHEARFSKVSNWKVYCMQLEEENVEGSECQPVEMDECSDMVFANLYAFRVVRVNRPWHSSVRIRGCRRVEFLNVHNYSQVKHTTDIAVYDQDKDIEARPWEFARLTVTGDEASRTPGRYGGFEFAEGIASDSRGNIYFCDHRLRHIWRWSPEKGLNLIYDLPWKPVNIAFDSLDNILVTFRYDPQPGLATESVFDPYLPDRGGTSFSGWGNSGFAILACTFDVERPGETIRILPLAPMGSVREVHKALWPSNRWRDGHDFNSVSVRVPEQCFVAPDGKTIIPRCYDLARSSSLVEAYPGGVLYACDEYDRRTVRMDVAADGSLSGLSYFVEDGEFGVAVDGRGNVYVAAGNINVYSPEGRLLRTIHLPERPSTLTIVGDTLYATGRSRVFSLPLSGI